MEEVDILIIGAGVVGLAVGKEVAKDNRRVIILERNNSFGRETSSRNSEVIHGGMYYPAGTLKARLCVRGRRLLRELCEKYRIPHRWTGKVIVAVDEMERSALEGLYALGCANGVEDLAMLDAAGLKKVEPNVRGLCALHSPCTGIIDSHKLMAFLLRSARDNGAMVAFDAEAVAIEKIKNGYSISVRNGNDVSKIEARVVVNSAGLDSDMVAGMAGIDVDKDGYRLHYCKGQYFRVNGAKSRMVGGLVYPVPRPKAVGLGIHATVDLAGSLRLGPDDEYMKERVKDYSVDSMRAGKFCGSIKAIMPFIEHEDIVADTSGIRPKLQEAGGEFRDFVIKDESERGLPGFVNLIGIESPGLTASPAIAEYVGDMAERILC
ncbi:MAG: NAD(P)/FAD-dependent oxidoreductase [Candidatus Omnitrophica bacterium]|nr:NAD(P)/FAD-dependent oxidoreductase [Candidatus Omnitrophota bacterium]